MWTQDMFGVEKPIIALLHLDALPGDPGYCGNMDVVVQHAREDLLALQDGGVDGILLQMNSVFRISRWRISRLFRLWRISSEN